MQDLRLIGVHEDGLHLLLADDEGNRYRVRLDEPLRAAARRDRPRLGQLQIEIEGGLRPKDVQAMIRAGLTAEEVAERAGWTVEKVHRYEGPILAEREHVAGLARQVRLRARGAGHSGSPTLDTRVSERMRSREIDSDGAQWDSRRSDRGLWTVLLVFNAGGRQREAAWDFDPLARTVTARDDEARWLSEDEDAGSPGPIPAPHLLVQPRRPSTVYDVEAEGGVNALSRPRRTGETVDLMEAMRERSAQRGRRRRGKATDVPGLEHAPEEALPIEGLTRQPGLHDVPPAAHPHPVDDPAARRTQATPRRPSRTAAPTQPVDPDADPEGEADQVVEPVGAGGPPRDHDVDLDDPPADKASEAPARTSRPAASKGTTHRKSGRPSVPSWDDIMFGRKSE